MKPDWEEVTLHEVSRPRQWATIRKSDLVDEGFPVYGANGVIGYYTEYNHAESTILIGCRGSCGSVHLSLPKAYVTGNAMALDDLDEARADIRFLYWFLRVNGLQPAVTGTSQPQITSTSLERIRVPLPPIEEQRRIAAVLDEANELRAKRRTSLRLIDSLTESIFLDMFGDPVTNPRRWPMFAFGEVCPTRLGKMLDQKRQTGTHRRPYLRNANVRWFAFDLADLAEMDFDLADRNEFRIQAGDILICEGGEPGRAAVWSGPVEEIYFQKALHRGRPDPSKATATYLVHLLWHLARRGGLADHISSATIAHLTGARLKAMNVPVPDLTLQHDFEKRLREIERSRRDLRRSAKELESLFSSLQHRAFAGQL